MLKKLINNKVFIILICILIAFTSYKIFFVKEETVPVYNLINKDNILEDDLNGDKKKDTIIIKHTNEGLIGQVDLNNNKTYSLDYSKDLPTLGQYCSYWPVRITTLDISRDNSKEIFLQSTFNNKPLQNIFSWDGAKYVNLFSSTNNILGFMDSHNSKTPKVISANYQGGDITFKGYLYNKGNLEEFTTSNAVDFPGKDTIISLISLIHLLPNEYITVPDYFYPQISGSDLESLFRLANSSFTYKFQDAYFIDLAWQENGKVTCANWILNFTAMSTTNPSVLSTMTINLMINKYNDNVYPYQITSFNVYH